MIQNRIGIIDIGTNTFNLLVVDRNSSGFEKVLNTKVGVGLGLGGITKQILTLDAIERGVQALKTFLSKCKELEVSKIKAFATSAVRDAANREDFLKILKDELSLEVEVISGDREADLIHQGVKMGYPFEKPALIMDIGGGSTEFIYASANEVIKAHSFNIGTARIYQTFEFEDPYSEINVQRVIDYLEEHTSGFFDDISTEVLVGASGSFETFYAVMYLKEYPENDFEDMDAMALNGILEKMIYSSYQERLDNPFIIPIRKTMAPLAAIKIKWIIDKLKIKTLTISPFAMKEGVIQIV